MTKTNSHQPQTTPAADQVAEQPTLLRTTVRLSWSIMLGMLAALALQIWITMFLGWQGPRALYVRSVYTPVGFLIMAVTEGLIVATQVAAGTAARVEGRARALRAIPTFLTAGCGVLALTAIGFLVARGPLLARFGVPPQHRTLVSSFIVTTTVSSVLGLATLLESRRGPRGRRRHRSPPAEVRHVPATMAAA